MSRPSRLSPVFISGWGLATPLGTNTSQTWSALLERRFIADHATVPLPPDETSRVSQLASHVAREALAAAGWSAADLVDDQTALVVGTSKGPVVEWLKLDAPGTPRGGIGLSQIATALAGGLGLGRGPRLTVSAACASGLHALARAAMMLRSREATRALVVAVESSVHPLFLSSFQRLGVLPKNGGLCRPFDRNRGGFLMSEAAAAVCLDRRAPPGGYDLEVEDFAIGGAGGHLTAGDPDAKLWRRLLTRVVDGRPLDVVHAHATGTVLNDPIELAAIESVLNSQSPCLYSHKGAIGHSLGAAGLVAIVLNCMAHRHGTVPGNVNLLAPLSTRRVILSADAVTRPVQRSIATASGFGGPTAVISLVSGPL